MRSRVGGFIGPPRRPASYAASGMWTLGEQHSSRTENQWPRNYLVSVSLPEYFDVTTTPDATIYSSADTNLSPSYVWKKSTNNGSTWSVVAGQNEYYLTLTGITSEIDGNLYKVEATSGLRAKASNTMSMRYETSFAFDWYPTDNFAGAIGSQASFYGQVWSIIGSKYGGYYGPSDMQWQQSTNGGTTWTDIAGENNNWLYVDIDSGMNNRKYRLRARVSSSHAWYASPAATLTITT